VGKYQPNSGKQSLFSTGSIVQDAIPFSSGKQKLLKTKLGLNKPKMPAESESEKDLRDRQALQLLELDQKENRRIKSIFRGGQGANRIFRGTSAASAAKAGSGGAGAPVAPSAPIFRVGGDRGMSGS
jgi:hypothetical protein